MNENRKTMMVGSSTVFVLTLVGLILGRVFNRLVIAPDVGIVVLLVSLLFYLMARVEG